MPRNEMPELPEAKPLPKLFGIEPPPFAVNVCRYSPTVALPLRSISAAVIRALAALREPCLVTLTTDSKYVCDAVTKGWVYGWQRKGWRKADGKPALNVDLWQQLLPLLQTHTVTFNWVKGHAGHPYNERCDALAVQEYTKHK